MIMELQKKIVPISKIMNELIGISDSTTFGLYWTDENNTDITIFETADFVDDIYNMHYEKSFVCGGTYPTELGYFSFLWHNFVDRNIDEFKTIYYNSIKEYDPLNEYAETKILTPDLTNSTSLQHGHVIDYDIDHHDDTTTYGGNVSNKINTFDGTQHNASYSQNGGNDKRAYKETNKTTNSGIDKTTQKSTGTSTETKSGYRNSAAQTLTDDIIFKIRCNIRDLAIKQFANEQLFYSYD